MPLKVNIVIGRSWRCSAELGCAQFSSGYDEQSLHMGWQASNYGALRNSGGNFQRYFKTGAVLYQPIASGTADKDGWEPHTAAGGTARCCVATGGCSPAMVGTLIVREKSRADQQFENVLPEDKKQPTASKDIVDDILNDLDGKQK